MFVENKNPSKYGIVYTESPNELPNFLTYETEEKRDSVFSIIINEGEIVDSYHYMPRVIRPMHFSKFELSDVGYTRNSLFGKSYVGAMDEKLEED